MRAQERLEPARGSACDSGCVREAAAVGDHRRVAAPVLEELGAREPAEAARGVGDAHVVAVDAVEHDPVVALPVHDRRQRQLVEPALRRADRAGVEAELLGAARDPGERRPVGRRVHDLADVRDRDGAAEVAADHRQARGAAVHLVELVDVREAAPSSRRRVRRRRRRARRPSSAPIGRRPRAVGDLVDSDASAGQDLLGEVERHAREAPVVVLRGRAPPAARGTRGARASELLEECERAAAAGGSRRRPRRSPPAARRGRASARRRSRPCGGTARSCCAPSLGPVGAQPPSSTTYIGPGGSPSRTTISPAATSTRSRPVSELAERLVRAARRSSSGCGRSSRAHVRARAPRTLVDLRMRAREPERRRLGAGAARYWAARAHGREPRRLPRAARSRRSCRRGGAR